MTDKKFGPYAAPAWASSQRTGDVALKAVLLLLANYADENYSCYPGQKRIADETEQSDRTVRRQIEVLMEADLLHKEHRYDEKGRRTSDRYFLHLHVTVTKDDVKAARDRIAAGKRVKPDSVDSLQDTVTGSESEPTTGHQMSGSDVDYRTPEHITTGHGEHGDYRTPDVRVTPSRTPSENSKTKKPSVTADAATPDDGGFILISMPPPTPAFDEFWEHYPRARRVGKGDARKAFERACKRASTDRIVAGVRRFAADPNLPSGDEVQFIPHPATWLNQDRWDDPPLPLRVPARGNNGFTHQHTQDNSGRVRDY